MFAVTGGAYLDHKPVWQANYCLAGIHNRSLAKAVAVGAVRVDNRGGAAAYLHDVKQAGFRGSVQCVRTELQRLHNRAVPDYIGITAAGAKACQVAKTKGGYGGYGYY